MCDYNLATGGGFRFPRGKIAGKLRAMDRRKIEACLPSRLHSFSRQVLDAYLAGRLSTGEFRRWFHMPNSDYLPVSDCIAQLVDPDYIPEARLPASTTLVTPKEI
jgi:hypothetical protein